MASFVLFESSDKAWGDYSCKRFWWGCCARRGLGRPQTPSVSDIFIPSPWKLWSCFIVVLTNEALNTLSVVRIITLTFGKGVEKCLNWKETESLRTNRWWRGGGGWWGGGQGRAAVGGERRGLVEGLEQHGIHLFLYSAPVLTVDLFCQSFNRTHVIYTKELCVHVMKQH